MTLAVECVIGCILFGTFIVLSVLKNQAAWINEYPEPVQKRYIELHPDCRTAEPEGLSPRVKARRMTACLIYLRAWFILQGQNLLCKGLCIVTAYGLW